MAAIDVIVPCYRYGRYLQQAVESVLAQQQHVRVLVLDDCSPDETEEVGLALSKADVRVTFRRHPTNLGHIATYNEGIEWVTAKYYMILSADDYLLPGALYQTVGFMEANPSIGLAFGQAITWEQDANLDLTSMVRAGKSWQLIPGVTFLERSGARNIVPTPAAVVRTSLQKRIGGYRVDLPHAGDMELWFRLASYSDVGISQGSHAVYRRHDGNMSSTYMVQCWLPDLEQRKLALDTFLDSSRSRMPEAGWLHTRSMRLLAREALGFANAAFNQGELELSRRLSRLAAELNARTWISFPGLKLACKRTIGIRAWQSLRAHSESAANSIRLHFTPARTISSVHPSDILG